MSAGIHLVPPGFLITHERLITHKRLIIHEHRSIVFHERPNLARHSAASRGRNARQQHGTTNRRPLGFVPATSMNPQRMEMQAPTLCSDRFNCDSEGLRNRPRPAPAESSVPGDWARAEHSHTQRHEVPRSGAPLHRGRPATGSADEAVPLRAREARHGRSTIHLTRMWSPRRRILLRAPPRWN